MQYFRSFESYENHRNTKCPILTSTAEKITCMLRIPMLKRTSLQKSNKNDIFMARVKNSNCLNFCTQVDPSKSRKTVYFFPQICCYFREKRTFRFHPLESMDRVITGRKLNTFARFAFQRYYFQGNIINVYSFIDSLSSVKCKLCRNWLLRSFQPCEKKVRSLPLQKKVGEENLFVHHLPLFRIPQNYVCKLPKE